VLTIVDTWSQFSPAVDPRFSYRAGDVVATLDRVCAEVGFPKMIRVDQGSEFISRNLVRWTYLHGVILTFSRPACRSQKEGLKISGLLPNHPHTDQKYSARR
jgi:putative transposase